MRVLLADDHVMVRESVAAYLRRQADAVIGAAGTFGEALDMAKVTPFDIILLDLNMPGMFGAASVETMVKALPDSRVVVFSSTQDPSVISSMMRAGARGFIAKDMRLGALMPALNLILAGETFLPQAFFRERSLDEPAQAAAKADLTEAEISFLRLALVGTSNKAIGFQLGFSESYAKTMMRRIFLKLGAQSRTQAVFIAQEKGLI